MSAVQFWSPYYRIDIILLESVQRRMTKMIEGIRNFSNERRLKLLSPFIAKITNTFFHFGLNKGDIDDFMDGDERWTCRYNKWYWINRNYLVQAFCSFLIFLCSYV